MPIVSAPPIPVTGSLGLCAPAAVEVQVCGTDRRVFRLSRALGAQAVILEMPAPFEPDSPVTVRFDLPGGDVQIHASGRIHVVGEDDEQDGEQGGKAIIFQELDDTLRNALTRYVRQRLDFPV